MERGPSRLIRFIEEMGLVIFRLKYMVILAVVASLFVALMLFLFGFYELFVFVKELMKGDPKKIQLVALRIAEIFLFGMAMLIFALGSYSLFINRLDRPELTRRTAQVLPDWIRFRNFGELKAIFIKVIILILAVFFLELTIGQYERLLEGEPYMILVLPVGLLMIAIALMILERTLGSER